MFGNLTTKKLTNDFSVADPGSGIRCLFDPWIRDPGWVKSQDPDPGSGMNNPNHISYSLETIFWDKILRFLDADSGSGMEKIRIRDPGWKKVISGIWDREKYPGSVTLHVLRQHRHIVLLIRDILRRIRMRIRIPGSVSLTNGSGCGSGRSKNIRVRNTGTFTSFFKDKKS